MVFESKHARCTAPTTNKTSETEIHNRSCLVDGKQSSSMTKIIYAGFNNNFAF